MQPGKYVDAVMRIEGIMNDHGETVAVRALQRALLERYDPSGREREALQEAIDRIVAFVAVQFPER